MFTGVLRGIFRIRGARSLKDKRHALRSLKDRLAARFHCSVAEVDAMDMWQRAVLGLAVVSGTESHCREMLDDISRYMRLDPEMECIDIQTEILSFLQETTHAETSGWDIPENLLFENMDDDL